MLTLRRLGHAPRDFILLLYIMNKYVELGCKPLFVSIIIQYNILNLVAESIMHIMTSLFKYSTRLAFAGA